MKVVIMESLREEYVSHMVQRSDAGLRGVTTMLLGEAFVGHTAQR
jgi:hypothetical protein